MSRYAWAAALAFAVAGHCAAQSAVPDLRGTWKGDSESVMLGAGNSHHSAGKASEPQLRSVPFTLVVDKQDGRRFSGTFSSPRGSEKIVAVVSRNGTILLADDDGYTTGTMLAPNKIELCYLRMGRTRIASCTELTKQ